MSQTSPTSDPTGSIGWKASFIPRVLTQSHLVRVTGVTSTPSQWEAIWRLFPYFMAVMVGSFITIAVMRPDLIDWHTFFRSFMIGIIIGRY